MGYAHAHDTQVSDPRLFHFNSRSATMRVRNDTLSVFRFRSPAPFVCDNLSAQLISSAYHNICYRRMVLLATPFMESRIYELQ